MQDALCPSALFSPCLWLPPTTSSALLPRSGRAQWCPLFRTCEAREGSFSTQALRCHSELGLPTSFLISVGAGGLSGRAL